MEIITTHHLTDLDGFASLILANKLHPKAKIILPTTLGNNVKKLFSLFKEILNFNTIEDINLKYIKKIILVDTSGPTRIDPFDKILDNVELVIYDHHPRNKINSKYCSIDVSQKYGSNTSYLLDLCIHNIPNFHLKKYELDISLLGIYEDTGNFLFPTTTFLDFKMASFLVEHGGNIRMIKDFTTSTLTYKQENILKTLIKNTHFFYFGKETIGFSKISSENFIGGINELIDNLMLIQNCNSYFIFVESKNKISIIGRSNSEHINLENVFHGMGGGGFSSAYSTTYKNGNISKAQKLIKEKLNNLMAKEKTAYDIMSSPVKVIDSSTTLKDAYILSERTGHSGFPIIENHKLVGVISKKEINRFINHNLGHFPVKKYMNKNLIVGNKNFSLSKLKNLIIENNIGRIPILDNNKIIGIVTRTDILNAFYEDYNIDKTKEISLEIINQNFILNLPSEIQNILSQIKAVSKLLNEKVYLVGGIVRDLILNLPNEDIDIVVENDANNFAKNLSEFLPTAKIRIHDQFKTATIFLENGLSIDIATLRSEYYEYPTALPIVTQGTIKDDLFRRDFTINALAIDISHNNFGKLLDFFKGYNDIKNKNIKIIHNISFIDDPTRIIRACRFASRYNFTIENETHDLILDAIEMGILERLSWNRLKNEFQYILEDKNPSKGILLLNKYNLLKLFHDNIILDKSLLKKLNLANKFKNIFAIKLEYWIVFLLVLTSQLNSKELEIIFLKFGFSKNFINKHKFGIEKRKILLEELNSKNKNSEIYSLLKNIPEEVLILLILESTRENKVKIKSYLFNLKGKVAIIKGRDLLELGLESGPHLKEYIEKSFLIQLDQINPSKDSILKELNLIC
ncbi:tRNA nucleotidyltransferase (CCA-adding enzyme) [Cetobacterium ceti]|uniref:tRNA nucleotidyltransferase (CCA-adding enzyme) n=1 Tax=Cetobacterium ceti TaxID=180163 RepID=A0A1T4JZI4_9FUSO|nr:CBS domain-containing protein [Cetobacterium ceti]SJZ35529.1 tRNA nucleotidyltransferase (CCA-adding enzyme) [Cetobacterium ceti]